MTKAQRIAAGLCRECGKPREHYITLCDECNYRVRVIGRIRTGSKKWRPGGKGRPPKDWVALNGHPSGSSHDRPKEPQPIVIEQICRELLAIALDNGIVSYNRSRWADPHPCGRSDGELAQMSEYLTKALPLISLDTKTAGMPSIGSGLRAFS